MLKGLAILLVLQLVGEALSRQLSLSVPGPVVGLVLMAIALLVFVRTGKDLKKLDVSRVSDQLLGALGLLFVPAGAGVVQQLGLLGENGLALIIVIIASTTITMLATVGTVLGVKWLMRTKS